MSRILGLLLGLLLPVLAGSAEPTERWVTLSPAATELVHALGFGDHVVGTDAGSTFPEAMADLPKVGSHHRVSVEGVLSLRPSRVVATADIGPHDALDQLRAVGIEVVSLPEVHTLDDAHARVTFLAEALGVPDRGATLVTRHRRAADGLAPLDSAPRVVFVYARGAGTMMLGGHDTTPAAVVRAAGGTYAAGWDGYRPITAEALVALAPDVLLLTHDGLASLGGVEGILQAPGVALTPAGHARRVVTVDAVPLLTLGPRLDEALRTLHAGLRGDPP